MNKKSGIGCECLEALALHVARMPCVDSLQRKQDPCTLNELKEGQYCSVEKGIVEEAKHRLG